MEAQRRNAVLEHLETARRNGAVAHCYLFTGPRGAGKMNTAKTFAATLLGAERERLLAHPDFFMLARGEADEEISIDEVRALRGRLMLTSACGGWRVAIIERVELLAKDAASALLKTLEEPGEKTVIVMTAERFGAVLPTIRSRAVRTAFPPQKKRGDGAPEALQKELDGFFERVSAMPLGLRFKTSERFAKNVAERQQLIRYAAEILETKLLDNLREGNGAQKTLSAIRSLLRTDALLTHTNTNPRLLLDVFLMQL